MAYCTACGITLVEGAKFCHSCGGMAGLLIVGSGPSSRDETKLQATNLSYAGFWKRFAAMLIDSVVVNLVSFSAGVMFAVSTGSDKSAISAATTKPADFLEAGPPLSDFVSTASDLFPLVIFVATWVYFAGMESSFRQATLGKIALGIKVVDSTGSQVSFGKASGRYFGKVLSALTLGIGFLMAAFTGRKQALHDIVAGCLVVNK